LARHLLLCACAVEDGSFESDELSREAGQAKNNFASCLSINGILRI
jgi:hypothetical protein